jgi:hypothetical protein
VANQFAADRCGSAVLTVTHTAPTQLQLLDDVLGPKSLPLSGARFNIADYVEIFGDAR